MSKLDYEFARIRFATGMRGLACSIVTGLATYLFADMEGNGSLVGLLLLLAALATFLCSSYAGMQLAAGMLHALDGWILSRQKARAGQLGLWQFGLRHLFVLLSIASVAFTILRIIWPYLPKEFGDPGEVALIGSFVYGLFILWGATIIRDNSA